MKNVSAEAIRIILWILGFMSFGYGSKEFEVTKDRLGCYRPEEHIDNPLNYADNLDARRYDPRLRGPVDERRELAIDPRNGLKAYIASEDYGITTSAGLLRNLFGRSIQLGRQYARSRNKEDLFEALRLLGTGCHCMEDYSAHSNYVELALIEMGEDVFPYVGRRTAVQVQGARQPIFPIVTGTFGGTDFLYSVMGEFSDKAAQSEMQELEGTISGSESQGNESIVKDLLNQLPSGLFGGKDQASKVDDLQANAAAARLQNMHVSPKEPEAFTRQLNEISKQIRPVLEFHDEIMQSITETIEKIPILPDLIENLENQVSIFVFSLLAPFVLPIIRQVKTELATGSSEIISSSKAQQLHVFNDDIDSNPTHSMLSKDHFSVYTNTPAGQVASQVLKWAVPQLIQAWDDERIDPNRTITRIINGVFHHPALRQYGDDGAADGRMLMFGVVQRWWGEKQEHERQDLRQRLSREGVKTGRNHKEGVSDSGHGCCKPLGMPNTRTASSSGAIGGMAASAVFGELGNVLGSNQSGGQQYHSSSGGAAGSMASEAVGGGAVGGIVGGLVGAVGGGLLGSAFGRSDEKKTFKQSGYEQDGSYTTSYTETGRTSNSYASEQRYGQAEYKETRFEGGGKREEYNRYEQDGRAGLQGGYGSQEIVETRPAYGGGYEQTVERVSERPEGSWESRVERERFDSSGQSYDRQEERHQGSRYGKSDSDSSDSDEYSEKAIRKREKKEQKQREKEERERREQGGGYQQSSYQEEQYSSRNESSTGYGGSSSYGRERTSRDKYNSGNYQPQSAYGGGSSRQNESYNEPSRTEYGGGSYGVGHQKTSYDGNRDYGASQTEYVDRNTPGGFGSSEEYNERQDYDSRGSDRREEYGESQESYGGNYDDYGGQQEESYGEERRYGDDY